MERRRSIQDGCGWRLRWRRVTRPRERQESRSRIAASGWRFNDMGSLLTALQSSASAMQTFEQALETIGNNVSNSSTPGYADQSVALTALPFQPSQGLPGGVAVGAIQSSRNEFAEQNVR